MTYKRLLDINIKVIRYSDDTEHVYIDGMYAPPEIETIMLKYAKEKERIGD